MGKENCWEYKKCGRQPEGCNAYKEGTCIAATETRVNGINDGSNGGRACWAIAGTLCGGKPQGSFAQKLPHCMACDFYKLVGTEQGPEHESSKDILEKLKVS